MFFHDVNHNNNNTNIYSAYGVNIKCLSLRCRQSLSGWKEESRNCCL